MSQLEQAQAQQWNIEVVKGKLTTRCFWNACKAFTVGMILLGVGTAMATVGYFSIKQEPRGNSTVSWKYESRGFHLSNLSYAGPIVMGLGGFIVVAACVMTFEARDSAAKVVSARPKQAAGAAAGIERAAGDPMSASTATAAAAAAAMATARRQSSRRTAGCQTRSWARDRSPMTRAATITSAPHDPGRREMTAAFVQFSRSLQRDLVAAATVCQPSLPAASPAVSPQLRGEGMPPVRSPSAPDLLVSPRASVSSVERRPCGSRVAHRDHSHCSHSGRTGSRSRRRAGDTARASPARHRRSAAAAALVLRQALSVDVPDACRRSRDSMELGASASASASVSVSVAGSQELSVAPLRSPPPRLHQRSLPLSPSPPLGSAFALPQPQIATTSSSMPPLMAMRSDTARRHVLLRQRPVEDPITSAAQVHAPPVRSSSDRSQ